MHNAGFSLYGDQVGIDNRTGQLISRKGIVHGLKGYELRVPGSASVVVFDDFLGDLVGDEWNYVEGTDSSTAVGAVLAGGVNGVFRLTPGDSDGSVAADYAQLNSGNLQWKANSGNLVFQTRVKLAAITSVSCFLGFTDVGTIEQPIYSASSANTITTDADDAVGFFFDTNMGTDNWWFGGVKATVDATHQNTGFAPVADTYETFRIEVDSSGNATGFRNGRAVGTVMSNAVTATVGLTPHIGVRPLSAAANKHLDIDYVYVASDRV